MQRMMRDQDGERVSRCSLLLCKAKSLGKHVQASQWMWLVVGLWGVTSMPLLAQSTTVTLRGFVADASDGQPIQGVNVVLEQGESLPRGAATNRDGFYQIAAIPAGTYALRMSFIGYEAYTDTLVLGADPFVTLSIELTPAAEMLDEVVIAVEAGAARTRAGLQTLRPQDLARIPTPDATGDLATYLQSLPSVVAIGDRGGQLFVRGGTPSQNMVLVDGFLIYQPFHIIGFFSAFPQDLVSHVDMYAGGFGARYSGRISSVIDVSMREGNKQFFEGSASLSPFLANVTVEGPLRKGEVSLLASMRHSTIERVAPTLIDDDLPFRFSDLFIKIQQTDRFNNRCGLTVVNTYDRGRIAPDDVDRRDIFRWSNLVVGGRCLAVPSASPFLVEVNTGLSHVNNEVGSPDAPERSSSSLELATNLNLTRLYQDAELRIGLAVRMNWLRFELQEQFQNAETNDGAILSLSGFVEPEFRLSEALRISTGVSLSLHPLRYPASIEPRIRMAWRPGGEQGPQEFSAALGLYRQTLAAITDERDAGSAFIAWVAAPVRDTQAQAIHALLGWQRQLAPWLYIGAEGYYKRLSDLPIPIWSTIARFTTALDLAKGNVYGFDTRIEVQQGGFYGYVGYGYSETEYIAQQDNFGLWYGETLQRYHPPHDRRHQLNAVLSFDIKGVTANLRWQYGSGLPFTRPFGFDELLSLRPVADVRRTYGTTRVLYDRPYEGRLPEYHRLDVSVDRTFTLKQGTLTAQAGVINIYDRNNLFYFDLFTVRRVDQLPFIPNLSIKYATR